ncbi:MAG: single-stranded DNA-binding protein [Rhodospirillaceae bacterium]|nr:single-stranded DNA-binding protein [Rhodospirillaceae bacterium]
MAFGKNYAEIVGHLGGDVVINHLASGGRVANLSVATDESYFDKSGQKVDQTEWHRVVTFQDGLISMLERHAKKGRLISVEGKLRTRRWKKDGDDSWRYSTEILVVPGNRLQFYDKPNRANGNGAQAEPAPANGGGMPAGGDPAQADDLGSDRIPF